MKKILFVHQGFELYGSDRCFIETVAAAKALKHADISAIIPQNGPILAPLQNTGAAISIKPLWILRRADLLKRLILAWFTFPLAFFQACKNFRQNDLVYINTAVVLDYIIAARFFKGKAVIHLHEVPQGKTLRLFQALIRFSRADVVFNSHYTKSAYPLHPSQKSAVIYNGIEASSHIIDSDYSAYRPLHLLLLGRINRMKGQEITLEAMALLSKSDQNRINLTIVGSVFGVDQTLADDLKRRAEALDLLERVTFSDFIPDPRPLIQSCDLLLMPSTMPETLGRSAIEALSEGRGVIVSKIGGLPETCVDGVCGALIEPNNAQSLAASLRFFLDNPAQVNKYGKAGIEHFNANFKREAIDAQMHDFLMKQIERPHV